MSKNIGDSLYYLTTKNIMVKDARNKVIPINLVSASTEPFVVYGRLETEYGEFYINKSNEHVNANNKFYRSLADVVEECDKINSKAAYGYTLYYEMHTKNISNFYSDSASEEFRTTLTMIKRKMVKCKMPALDKEFFVPVLSPRILENCNSSIKVYDEEYCFDSMEDCFYTSKIKNTRVLKDTVKELFK